MDWNASPVWSHLSGHGGQILWAGVFGADPAGTERDCERWSLAVGHCRGHGRINQQKQLIWPNQDKSVSHVKQSISMKGLLTRFADGLLSREQMKKVMGGYENIGCPDGVNYATEQACTEKCKAKAYAKCSYNSYRGEYQCACTD